MVGVSDRVLALGTVFEEPLEKAPIRALAPSTFFQKQRNQASTISLRDWGLALGRCVNFLSPALKVLRAQRNLRCPSSQRSPMRRMPRLDPASPFPTQIGENATLCGLRVWRNEPTISFATWIARASSDLRQCNSPLRRHSVAKHVGLEGK